MTKDKISDVIDAVVIGSLAACSLAFTVYGYRVGGFQAVVGILAVALPSLLLGRSLGQRDVLKTLKGSKMVPICQGCGHEQDHHSDCTPMGCTRCNCQVTQSALSRARSR